MSIRCRCPGVISTNGTQLLLRFGPYCPPQDITAGTQAEALLAGKALPVGLLQDSGKKVLVHSASYTITPHLIKQDLC